MSTRDEKSLVSLCSDKKNFPSDLKSNPTKGKVYGCASLPDDAVKEFQEVYEQAYKVRLDLGVARELAIAFLDLYQFTSEVDP